MRINHLLLLCVLLIPIRSTAQLETWTRTISNGGADVQPVGWLEETDETVRFLNQQVYTELSHYGEAIDNFMVPGGGALVPFRAGFLFDSKMLGGENIYLQANRDRKNIIYVTLFDDDQNVINQIELADSISGGLRIKGPGAISLSNQEYWIFGNQSFQKVRWTGVANLEVVETQPGNFGVIAAAANTDDGFILCNESGFLIATDQDANVLWSKQLNAQLTDVQSLNDGYIICGEDAGAMTLIRTDVDGNILWQKTYANGTAFDLTVASNGDFVFTGTDENNNTVLFRTNDSGDISWQNSYGGGTGINVIESRYGGFYLQAKTGGNTQLTRVGEDGQVNSNNGSLGVAILDVNDVMTTTSSSGVLFRERNNAFYRVPKDSLTSTVFTSGLWLSARNNNNDLHVSAQDYQDQWSRQDYQPGYIGADPEHFDKVWAVSKKQIELFREDYAQADKIAPWLYDIITWPAKGNPNVLVNQESVDIPIDLAPFVDVNGDGLYNAFDGDYPKIIGDQMLFWVMNDSPQEDTGGTPLGVDILCSMYAFSDEGVVNNVPATFVDFIIINRSDQDYQDLKLGLFTDYDLGCYFDDFVGTMPPAHAVYAYNEDFPDLQNCDSGVSSFQEAIPIQITGTLNHELTSSMYYNFNNVSTPPLPPFLGVFNPEDYDNFLQSTWSDGSPLTIGGNGYDPSGTPTPYMFSGNPSENGEWSLCDINLLSGDFRVVMGSSVDTVLAQGERIRYSISQVTLGEYDAPCPDVKEQEEHMIDIRDYFNSHWPDFTLDLGPDTLLNAGASLTLDAGLDYSIYDWSTGDATQTLLVTEPGIYSVVATTPLGFQRTDTIRVDFVTNTNELDVTAPMIFPNPSSGLLHISPGTVAIESVEVRNVLGQSLKQIPVSHPSTFQLNLSDLNTGTYLLLLSGQNGEQWLKKVLLTQ